MKESPFQNFSAYNWSKSQMLFVWNPEISSQWGTKLWQELPLWQPSDWTDAPTNKKRKEKQANKNITYTLLFFFFLLTQSWWMQYKIVLINHIHILQKKRNQWQWLSQSIKLTPGGCRAPCKKQMMGTDTILSKEWVMNNIPTDRGLIASSPESSLPAQETMLRGWIAMPTVVVDATVIRLRPR